MTIVTDTTDRLVLKEPNGVPRFVGLGVGGVLAGLRDVEECTRFRPLIHPCPAKPHSSRFDRSLFVSVGAAALAFFSP